MAVANAATVTVARQARGWTQAQLAVAAGVSQGYVSKIEKGTLDLEGRHLIDLAKALSCPVELLLDETLGPDAGVSCVHHRRRRSKLTASATRRVESLAQLTSLTVTRLIAGLPPEQRIHVTEDLEKLEGDPEDVAKALRRATSAPGGALIGLTSYVESLGIVVVRRHLSAQLSDEDAVAVQDGVSVQGDGRHPVILLNTPLSGDRERFTLAHELGHLLMHGWSVALGDEDFEREANLFAGALLLPANEVSEVLSGVNSRSLRKLLDLKHEWGVSVGALVERARQLGTVDGETYKTLRIRIVEYGWHRREPGYVATDSPSLLSAVIANYAKNGATLEEVSKQALMLPECFVEAYGGFDVNR